MIGRSLHTVISKGFTRKLKKPIDRSLKNTSTLDKLFDQNFHIENQQHSLKAKDISHSQFILNGRVIDVVGMPIVQSEEISEKNNEVLQEIFKKVKKNDVSLISIEPSYHISDKRLLQRELRKQILYNGQDIDSDAILTSNPTYPQYIDELRLDLLPLDFAKSSDEEKILQIQKIAEKSTEMRHEGYFTSLLFGKDKDTVDTQIIEKKFKELYEIINKNIFGEKELHSYMYPSLQSATVQSLVEGKHIFLGELPKIYQRMHIANNLDITFVKQMFKEILKFSKTQKIQDTSQFSKITPLIFSHLYSFTSDYYLHYVLQKITTNRVCKNGVTVFLKNYQVNPFNTLLSHYTNNAFKESEEFIEFMQIVENEQDNDEILLEKHAILDVLFADNLWEKQYIRNPFPYLQEDFTQLSAHDQSHISHVYSINVKKYTSVAKEFLKSL